MPIYSYRCDSCGQSRDVLQNLFDAPPSSCPACGGGSLTKQITAAHVHGHASAASAAPCEMGEACCMNEAGGAHVCGGGGCCA